MAIAEQELTIGDVVVQRDVPATMRDGTVLRLTIQDEAWKVPVLKAEGVIGETTVRLADLEGISFTTERAFEKK